jgi:hypothetical protein
MNGLPFPCIPSLSLVSEVSRIIFCILDLRCYFYRVRLMHELAHTVLQ